MKKAQRIIANVFSKKKPRQRFDPLDPTLPECMVDCFEFIEAYGMRVRSLARLAAQPRR